MPAHPEVKVYVRAFCGYCGAVERLLEGKGVAFERVDLTDDPAGRTWLRTASGQRTVPQVFVAGEPHGGFTDLLALDRAGHLDAILGLGA